MIFDAIEWIVVLEGLVGAIIGFALVKWFRRRYGKRVLAPLTRYLRRREYQAAALKPGTIPREFHAHFRDEIENWLTGRKPSILGKPILYLQGFLREGQGRVYWSCDDDPTIRFPVRMHSFLQYAFGTRVHLLVGVGGADSEVIKLKREDADWQETVWRLIDQVNVVLLRPFHSPSVLAELRHVLHCAPHKLILLMDPTRQ